MNFKIIEEKKQPLVSRVKVIAHITFDKTTPSNVDIRKKIAESKKVSEEIVVVKHIYTVYGKREASIEAYVYNSVDEMNKIEIKTKKQKEKEEAEKKKVEDAVAKVKEEAEQKKAEEVTASEEKKEEPAKDLKEEAPAEEKSESAPKAEEKPAEEKAEE